ncbi:MAG: DNA cytosine methyltransferase [Candidatus Electrothrix sp. MAN1_4]|nr:DNA cytosine methyltransferase [Candidatus Electrothrix sp. MAN1_4]
MAKLNVLDAFAGAGGFSLGFELSGCNIIGAIEQDEWACETFAFNHPKAQVIKSDIAKLTDNKIKSIFTETPPHIILGGPPCQGFSICNKNNNDPKDPRNSLFEEFIRLGKILKPKLMVMENVPNLIKARTTSKECVIDIISSELESIGYHVYFKILEATDYGIPQIRKRLFVVASKSKISIPFPKVTHTIFNGQLSLFEKSLTVTDLGEPHESLQVRRKLTGFVTSNHGTFFRSIVQPDSVVRRVFLP